MKKLFSFIIISGAAVMTSCAFAAANISVTVSDTTPDSILPKIAYYATTENGNNMPAGDAESQCISVGQTASFKFAALPNVTTYYINAINCNTTNYALDSKSSGGKITVTNTTSGNYSFNFHCQIANYDGSNNLTCD